jgi:hypothetical protein
MSWRHMNINNNVEIDYNKILITFAQKPLFPLLMWYYRIMCERVNLTELRFLKYIKAFKQ